MFRSSTNSCCRSTASRSSSTGTERSTFPIFNTAILAAAVALYKSGSTAVAKLGVAALLVLSAARSLVGRHSVDEGHKMYRAIRGTKTRLEKVLNLGDLAIQSTAGMKREHDEAAEGTPSTGKARIPSITFRIRRSSPHRRGFRARRWICRVGSKCRRSPDRKGTGSAYYERRGARPGGRVAEAAAR